MLYRQTLQKSAFAVMSDSISSLISERKTMWTRYCFSKFIQQVLSDPHLDFSRFRPSPSGSQLFIRQDRALATILSLQHVNFTWPVLFVRCCIWDSGGLGGRYSRDHWLDWLSFLATLPVWSKNKFAEHVWKMRCMSSRHRCPNF